MDDNEISVEQFMRRWDVFVDINRVGKRPDGLGGDLANHYEIDI
jgi:hypothetical protein